MPTPAPPAPSPTVAYSIVRGTAAPLGPLLLCTDGAALTAVAFSTQPDSAGDLADFAIDPSLVGCADEQHPVLTRAAHQLLQYVAGQRQVFDVPLRAHGTPFQKRVWDELLRIPYGQTISYQDLARRIGQPTASRAVGLANGRNPLAIVVPCHRVIGASGQLTGYGGGLPRKRWLLDLEARQAGPLLSFAWP